MDAIVKSHHVLGAGRPCGRGSLPHQRSPSRLVSLTGRLELPGSGEVAQTNENQISTHLQPAPKRHQLGPWREERQTFFFENRYDGLLTFTADELIPSGNLYSSPDSGNELIHSP